MADTILSSLLSSPSLTITSDVTSIDVAQSCGISKVSIKLRSKLFRHKREDGTSIVDARVLEPYMIEVDLFAPTLDSLALLNSAMLDRNGTYTVKSRGLVFRRAMMNQNDVKQTGDMLTAAPVRLTFKELMTQNLTNVGQTNVAQPADSTLIDKGIQLVGTAATSVTQLAQSIVGEIVPPTTASFLDGSWFLDGSRYLNGLI